MDAIVRRYAALLICGTACLANSSAAKATCDRSAVLRAYIADNYELALQLNNDCLAESRGKEPSDSQYWSWAKKQIAGFYLVVAAQIEAEKGDFQAAQDSWWQASQVMEPSWMIPDILGFTKGFILEKSGHASEALQAYLDVNDNQSLARAALIYLKRGDKTQATALAAKTLKADPQNLTAWIVLESSAYPNGTSGTLLLKRIDAVNHGSEKDLGANMPAAFAEYWWASIWLREAALVGPPPPDD